RHPLDKLLTLEAVQGFAHGCPGDPELRRKRVLGEHLPRGVLSAEDRVTNPLVGIRGHLNAPPDSTESSSRKRGWASQHPFTRQHPSYAAAPARRPNTIPAARPEPPG